MPFRKDKYLGLKAACAVLLIQASASAVGTLVIAQAASDAPNDIGGVLNEHTLIPAAVVVAAIGGAVSGAWWLRGIIDSTRNRMDKIESQVGELVRRVTQLED